MCVVPYLEVSCKQLITCIEPPLDTNTLLRALGPHGLLVLNSLVIDILVTGTVSESEQERLNYPG